MNEWAVIVVAVFLIVYRLLIIWVPELGLPVLLVGKMADAVAPWILLGIGLILREIRRQNRMEAEEHRREGYNPPPKDGFKLPKTPPPAPPPKRYDKRGRLIRDG